jgi:hypothetical protein
MARVILFSVPAPVDMSPLNDLNAKLEALENAEHSDSEAGQTKDHLEEFNARLKALQHSDKK